MAFTSNELQKDLEVFIRTTVQAEELKTDRSTEMAMQVLGDIFTRINIHEPRFSCEFSDDSKELKGLYIIDNEHMELRIYLDQIELFDIVETSAPKGATFLSIKNDRDKPICVWGEFLTATGNLSAKKIRDRFQVLLNQTVNRTTWTNRNLQVVAEKLQPRIRINNSLCIDIYPSFRNLDFWPKQGRGTFLSEKGGTVSKDRLKIDLISRPAGSSEPYSTDRDAWRLDFRKLEDEILCNEKKDLCFSVVRTIARRCLKPKSFVFDSAIIRTVFLYVCEKHPQDADWTNSNLPDRINSFLLQLVACLQSRCLPHYCIRNYNLLESYSNKASKAALNEAWKLAREFCTNQKFFKNN